MPKKRLKIQKLKSFRKEAKLKIVQVKKKKM